MYKRDAGSLLFGLMQAAGVFSQDAVRHTDPRTGQWRGGRRGKGHKARLRDARKDPRPSRRKAKAKAKLRRLKW